MVDFAENFRCEKIGCTTGPNFFCVWSMGFSGAPKDMGPPKMGSGTHTIPIIIPKDMGIVWEAYHRGSHYWVSLESPLI